MPAQAPFFWVTYGFEDVTPVKMYNANVSCAILLSFLKNACARDVEDYCKQKNIQLGIELDALNRTLQGNNHAHTSAGGPTPLPTDRSAKSSSGGTSRPPSGNAASRPITPTPLHADADVASEHGEAPSGALAAPEAAAAESGRDENSEELAAARAKIVAHETQLQVVAAASKLAKELLAGTATVDLTDDHGTRLKLDEAGGTRASALIKPRAHYSAVALTVDDKGNKQVVPLVFKLHKAPPEAAVVAHSSADDTEETAQ